MPTNDYRNYLAHHGILGQKWGIRRYQNADGSLTPKGQKRYNKQQKKEINKQRKAEMKNRRSLSDKDLSQKIDRLKKEKQFKELTNENISPGKTATKKILSKAGTTVATAAVTGALAYAGKKAFGNSDAGKYMFPNPHKKK